MDWIGWLLGGYALVACAVLFISWPYTESGSVPRGVVIRDSLLWPFWALLMIVEATEEARRGRLK